MRTRWNPLVMEVVHLHVDEVFVLFYFHVNEESPPAVRSCAVCFIMCTSSITNKLCVHSL